MKIADFFIALGFDIKGAPEVEKTDQAVEKLNLSSLKLLAGVTALNAAFYAMIARGVEVGVTLQKFALTTGMSTTELQKWQLTAVRGNVAAKEMAQAIGVVQKARAAIAFGNAEAAAPWMLLGIDPRQDPFKVLEQLRQQVLKLDPAIARQKLSEMGFGEDMLFLMRQQNFGRSNMGRETIVNPEETQRLAALGGAWKEFLFILGQVGARFAAQFAEPLAAVLNQLTRGLTLVGKFVDWLDKGSAGANAFKYALLGILVVLGGLQVALPLLMLGPFGAFLGAIMLIVVGLGGLILLIQDFWVACRGGKSLFDWNDGLLLTVKNVERLATAIEWFISTYQRAAGVIKAHPWTGNLGASILGAMPGLGGVGVLGRMAVGAMSGSSTQTNEINVTVPPASDPHTTGQAVGKAAAREISDAYGQMPPRSR